MHPFAALTSLALIWAAPALAASPSLCTRTEITLFSCPVHHRIVSVCAAPDLAPGRGDIQYRYGTRAKIALATPAPGSPPAQVMRAGTVMYSGGGGAYLRITNGAFRYTVFTAIGKWGKNETPAEAAGVFVEQDGADIADLPCTGPDDSQLGPDLFTRAGLPEDETGDDFEIPPAFLPN